MDPEERIERQNYEKRGAQHRSVWYGSVFRLLLKDDLQLRFKRQSKRSTKASKARAGDQPFTLAAFPHPARGLCTLRWTFVGTSAVGTIRVMDLQGRQVWEGSTAEGATEAVIPIAAMASGTYIVGISLDGRVAGTTLHVLR